MTSKRTAPRAAAAKAALVSHHAGRRVEYKTMDEKQADIRAAKKRRDKEKKRRAASDISGGAKSTSKYLAKKMTQIPASEMIPERWLKKNPGKTMDDYNQAVAEGW